MHWPDCLKRKRKTMNILHVKYAVEIAKTKSISKAAEALYTTQPNLSRAVKELEESLGITIFKRTPSGIQTTSEGEEFLEYARSIISQIEDVEQKYLGERERRQRLSVYVPRSSYISYALVAFAKRLDLSSPAEVFYKETNATETIAAVAKEDCNLGVVRYQETFDRYYKDLFHDKKLSFEFVADVHLKLLMSRAHPLAEKESIQLSDLAPYVEIAHADTFIPSLPLSDIKKETFLESVNKRIFVFERASKFLLLSQMDSTFMWAPPIPDEILDMYGLVLRPCADAKRDYKDMLIFRKNYQLSEQDNIFITELFEAKNKYLD